MILLCFCSGIFDVRCKNYLKLFFFVIVQLLEIAPRTACSLEPAFFRGCHSCTQAPVFHPACSTCVLLLIGVSFEWKLILPEKSSFLFPSLRFKLPPPMLCASPGPRRRPGRNVSWPGAPHWHQAPLPCSSANACSSELHFPWNCWLCQDKNGGLTLQDHLCKWL